METQEFKRKIKETLESGVFGEEHTIPRRVLKEAIEATVEAYKDQGLRLVIEPGFETELGRQLNVVVRIDSIQFRDVLFRAYVPSSGFPVSLDLFGENVRTCQDEKELRAAILEFIGRKDVSLRIRELAEESEKLRAAGR